MSDAWLVLVLAGGVFFATVVPEFIRWQKRRDAGFVVESARAAFFWVAPLLSVGEWIHQKRTEADGTGAALACETVD